MDASNLNYSLDEAASEVGIPVGKFLRLAVGCTTRIRHEVMDNNPETRDSLGGFVLVWADIEPERLRELIEHPARRNAGYIVPPQLVEEIREKAETKKRQGNQAEGLSTKEANTVFTILLGMADLCGYDPDNARNTAISRIAHKSRTDPKTVRRWLKEAADRVGLSR